MARLAARLLGASFVLLGLTFLVMTWMTYRMDTRIVREGHHAEGTVLRKEFIAASDDSDYVLHYAFSLPEGTRLKQQRAVAPELWKRPRIGEGMSIRKFGRRQIVSVHFRVAQFLPCLSALSQNGTALVRQVVRAKRSERTVEITDRRTQLALRCCHKAQASQKVR